MPREARADDLWRECRLGSLLHFLRRARGFFLETGNSETTSELSHDLGSGAALVVQKHQGVEQKISHLVDELVGAFFGSSLDGLAAFFLHLFQNLGQALVIEIGRASCRERV